MNSNLEIRSINLSTLYKSNGDLSSPSWILPEPIQNIRGLKIKQATIPLSFYTIDSRNNKIYFAENTTGSTTLTATLTSGNYTSTTFPAQIKSALEEASGSVFTYDVTFSTSTNLLSITATSGNIKFLAGSADCYYEMGINSSQLNSFVSTLTGSEVIDLSGVKIVHLVSNLPATKVIGQSYNILGSIPTEEGESAISFYEDQSSDYLISYKENLSDINISLYDSRFRRLTTRKDFSVTINFLTE